MADAFRLAELCGVGLLGVPEALASECGSLCHGDGAQGRAPESPRQVMLAIPQGAAGVRRSLTRAGRVDSGVVQEGTQWGRRRSWWSGTRKSPACTTARAMPAS